jgi:organic hydroperoxide reductase OsmC/OhrA
MARATRKRKTTTGKRNTTAKKRTPAKKRSSKVDVVITTTAKGVSQTRAQQIKEDAKRQLPNSRVTIKRR